MIPGASGVRRIFEKGGPGNLRILKTKRKISPLRISPFFCPKLGENKKKKRSTLRFSVVFGPKLGEDHKKKGLQSDFVRFCAPQTFCPSNKRRTMPQFYILCSLYYTGDPNGGEGGGMAPWPPPQIHPCLGRIAN